MFEKLPIRALALATTLTLGTCSPHSVEKVAHTAERNCRDAEMAYSSHEEYKEKIARAEILADLYGLEEILEECDELRSAKPRAEALEGLVADLESRPIRIN